MPNCTANQTIFPRIERAQIEANFEGGEITSDAGALLLLQAERHTQLIQRISHKISDRRDSSRITHSVESMLRQRIFAIALGSEDLNDHISLRHDAALQVATDRKQPLASASTLSRFEAQADRQLAWQMHEAMVDTFIDSYRTPPDEIILDIDATDDRVHGLQQGRFFHGYYGHYCFLPLYVFCGDHVLVSYLRRANQDGARHAGAIMRLLIKRLRQAWPDVRIVIRADSGFCRRPLMHWCENNQVKYLIGLAKNDRLVDDLSYEKLALLYQARRDYGMKRLRWYESRPYQARTWHRPRQVIAKLEVTEKGYNPRFVVTNLEGEARQLYKRYCLRGEMENRIKEQQLDLFADRTSCTWWWQNQLRLCLSSLAYVLLNTIRRIGLKGSKLARAQAITIRLKLLKIGAVVLKNTRRIRFLMSSSYPHQTLWMHAAKRLEPG